MKKKMLVSLTISFAATVLFVQVVWAQQGATLALAAARGSDVECIGCLDAGSDVDAIYLGDTFRRTPLMLASMNGHVSVVNLLIERGADVTLRDGNNATALHYACERGYLEVARALIGARADVNARDRFGDRPLFAATRCNNPQIVALLLTAGADPTLPSLYSGDTPLSLAQRNGFSEVADLLLSSY